MAAAAPTPAELRVAALHARLPSNPACIPKDLKEKLAAELNYKSHEDLYVDLVSIAKSYAVVPVSKFQVGVVGVATSGDLYLGCNIEFSGFPLNFSVHAEQCLVANLVRHEVQQLSLLMVNYEPCGHCRQFLSELYKSADLKIRILKGDGAYDFTQKPHTIESLLPQAFGPGDLGIGENERLLRPRTWTCPPDALVPRTDPMVAQALVTLQRCWAPFTRCRSAVVLRLVDGTLHSGAYMENAAYNPSLSPLQAALTALVLARRPFADIAAVLLIELEGRVSQEAVTRLLLANIAPTVNVHVYRLPAELVREEERRT